MTGLPQQARTALFLAAWMGGSPLMAAPLDALLGVRTGDSLPRHEIEASLDAVNDTIDVFRIRDRDAEFAGTHAGDYRGAHLRITTGITQALSLHGAWWQRRIDYRQDQARIDSWQLGLQHRLSAASGALPALAWRATAWGNQADRLHKSSPTSMHGHTIDSLTVTDPQDRQVQLDLIASWALPRQWTLSAFAGAGSSRVSLREISGTASSGGCEYRLAFEETRIVGTLRQPCSGSVVVDRFVLPNRATGADVYRDTRYRARSLQGGLSLRWRGRHWQLAAGYQYQHLDRGEFDERMQQQGKPVYRSNHTVAAEIRYRLGRHAELFGRGQAMHNQFVGEIPFLYNSYTSHRFGKRYGFASAGVIVSF